VLSVILAILLFIDYRQKKLLRESNPRHTASKLTWT